uniref:REC114 meiotic recombination protein n=1 Tax=Sphenodon punctatus TaxID=8508 RepID=A0A8D0LC66_SPHPU
MAAAGDSSVLLGQEASYFQPLSPPLPSVPEAPQGTGAASTLSSIGTWQIKRYGRFVSVGAAVPASGSWKVYESNEELGYLVLTIVVSGHFFISQRRRVLEGLSLIDARKWLKIVRSADCLLFGSKSKNEHRMFRVQFAGDSKDQAMEHCCNCVQKLAEYVTVQVMDGHSQELRQGQQLADGESQVKDSEQNTSLQHKCVLTSSTFDLPLAYRQSLWSTEELGPFIRLCLLDQNFPAFVDGVEKELKRLTEG